MALKDRLSAEISDHVEAAAAASQGRSISGFSGRHTEIPDARLGSGTATATGPTYGPVAEPIIGERVKGMQVHRVAPDGVEKMIADDPLFREQKAVTRQPFGVAEQQLAVEPRPGYRRYWFSDQPGRVARAKRAGYSHVTDPENGEAMARITDRADGRGRNSYLMEIPEQYYQEDMARAASELSKRLDDIRKGRAGPGAEDNRYIPSQGIEIKGR